MMDGEVAISVEHLSKRYRLGQIGATTLRASAERMWHRIRGRDPAAHMARIDERKAGSRQTGEHPARALPSANAVERRSAAPPARGDCIWALDDVSFEVRRGEVLGIIGRNGAGKSTLLKILSRITEPTLGRAVIRGRVGSLLEVGTGFHPELTGRENTFLNGAILGMTRRETASKFDEIVAFAELERFIDTPVKRYSSGMYVRLAFAIAAHLDPEILLADEVLAVGDLRFQRKCLGKMSDVARAGRTILFVSHNMQAVSSLCSRCLLIDGGKIACEGQVEKVVERYVSSEAGLTSEADLRGRVRESSAETLRFETIRVRNWNGRLEMPVSRTRGCVIEIEYLVSARVDEAVVAFMLYNGRGECVLTSTDADADPAPLGHSRGPGRYAARCVLAGEYLRSGSYRVDLVASVAGRRVLDQVQGAIQFEVIDDGHPEPAIGHGRRGVIAPRLPWEVEVQG